MTLATSDHDTSMQAIDVQTPSVDPSGGRPRRSESVTLASLRGVTHPPRGLGLGVSDCGWMDGGTDVPDTSILQGGPPVSLPSLVPTGGVEGTLGTAPSGGGYPFGDCVPGTAPTGGGFPFGDCVPEGRPLGINLPWGSEPATRAQSAYQPPGGLHSSVGTTALPLGINVGFTGVGPTPSPQGPRSNPLVPGPSGLHSPGRGLLRLAGLGGATKRTFTGTPSYPAPPAKVAPPLVLGQGDSSTSVTQQIMACLQLCGIQPKSGSATTAALPAQVAQSAPPTGGQAAAASPMQQGSSPQPSPALSRVQAEGEARDVLGYKDFLSWVLPSIGMEDLLVAETLKGDSLDHLAGLPSARAQWGLVLTEERGKQLQTALSPPALGRSLINGASPFRVTPSAYSGAFKLPSLDPHLASQQGAHSRPVPHTKVQSWVPTVGALYEANMSVYRLAFHQSILTLLLNQFVSLNRLDLVAKVIPFLAQSEKEMMATAANAASHSLAHMRQVALAPLDYVQKTKNTLANMPFEGGALFGPSLQLVLQGEVDTAKQALQGETILRERPPSKPKAKASVLNWTAKPRTTPPAPSSKPPQGQRKPGRGRASKPTSRGRGRGKRV